MEDILILSGDTVVAEWKNSNLKIINDSLLPLYLKNTGNVEKWLEIRAVDSYRSNSRLLKEVMGIGEKSDIDIVLYVNAATITDNYWVKSLYSSLKYDDVRFDNDYFSDLALMGKYDDFGDTSHIQNFRTPELTNIGSFEKCWKLKNGEWWMHKAAKYEELFSEYFIYRLGQRLDFKMAEYVCGEKVIKTKDFTGNAKVNFEPAFAFMGDNEDYIETAEKLKKICPNAIGDYVRMLFLDTICANPDRHTFNFGIIRDINNGDILGLAPNFDNNMALISRGYPKDIQRKNDLFVRLFNELMEYDRNLKDYVPELTKEVVLDEIKAVGMKVNAEEIADFVMNGYNMLER